MVITQLRGMGEHVLAHAILGDEYDDESEDDEHHDDKLGDDDCGDDNQPPGDNDLYIAISSM